MRQYAAQDLCRSAYSRCTTDFHSFKNNIILEDQAPSAVNLAAGHINENAMSIILMRSVLSHAL